MSVLIEMDMPENCCECKFFNQDKWVCNITEVEHTAQIALMDRYFDCPLIAVPSHGRLIDADALRFVQTFEEPDTLDYIRRYAIDRAPTIVDADVANFATTGDDA